MHIPDATPLGILILQGAHVALVSPKCPTFSCGGLQLSGDVDRFGFHLRKGLAT